MLSQQQILSSYDKYRKFCEYSYIQNASLNEYIKALEDCYNTLIATELPAIGKANYVECKMEIDGAATHSIRMKMIDNSIQIEYILHNTTVENC